MSFILVVDDDEEFSNLACDCIRATTNDVPLPVAIDENLVLEMIRQVHADISLILVSVQYPGDPGGLDVLWSLNECFPTWCVTPDRCKENQKLGETGASKQTLRQLLNRAGCQELFFKPCPVESMMEALKGLHRVPGGA